MKASKYKHKPDLLDARDYTWERWAGRNTDDPFHFARQPAYPVAVCDVFFDTETFDKTDYHANGVSFGFYGCGDIYEYAAVECDDGSILFCITNGVKFTDTFHSADRISMEYYRLTKRK